MTAQSLTVYKDSVCKTCDAMDSNIKVYVTSLKHVPIYFTYIYIFVHLFFIFYQSMYQLMAKCEELSKAMTPIYKLADQV